MQLSRVPQSSAVRAVGEPPPKGPAPQTHRSPLSPVFHPEKVWLMNVRPQPLCLLQQKQQLDSFTLTPGPTALRDLKGRRRRNPRLRDLGLLLSSADEDVCVCMCVCAGGGLLDREENGGGQTFSPQYCACPKSGKLYCRQRIILQRIPCAQKHKAS